MSSWSQFVFVHSCVNIPENDLRNRYTWLFKGCLFCFRFQGGMNFRDGYVFQMTQNDSSAKLSCLSPSISHFMYGSFNKDSEYPVGRTILKIYFPRWFSSFLGQKCTLALLSRVYMYNIFWHFGKSVIDTHVYLRYTHVSRKPLIFRHTKTAKKAIFGTSQSS